MVLRLGVFLVVMLGACAPREICDDAFDNDHDGLVDCADPVCAFDAVCGSCGDGVLDANEGCDDGNVDNDDDCTDRCALSLCGNARLDGDEECDDGNLVLNDFCNHRCQFPRCGDGVVDRAEECDDGTSFGGDGCTITCQNEGPCGDGALQPTEQCDDANSRSGDGCSAECDIESCGDGLVQSTLGEECDGELDGALCVDCRIERCGNGVLDLDEVCDDGNRVDLDGCTGCRAGRCGNGVVEGLEQCDDGDRFGDDGCSATCFVERCGNGLLENKEVCDEPEDASCIDCLPTLLRRGGAVITYGRLGPIQEGGPYSVREVVGLTARDDVDSFSYFVFVESNVARMYSIVQGNGYYILESDPSVGQQQSGLRPLDIDNQWPLDMVGCSDGLLAIHLLHEDGQITWRTLAFDQIACAHAIGADVDGDGRPEVFSLSESELTRVSDPAGIVELSTVAVASGVASRGGAVLLRGPTEQLLVLGNDQQVMVWDDTTRSLVETGQQSEQIFGVDSDGDGVDEPVLLLDGLLSFGDRRRSVSIDVLHFARGDLDGDGLDDLVAFAERSAVLMLSTFDYEVLDSIPIPVGGAGDIVDGALLVAGGRRLTSNLSEGAIPVLRIHVDRSPD